MSGLLVTVTRFFGLLLVSVLISILSEGPIERFEPVVAAQVDLDVCNSDRWCPPPSIIFNESPGSGQFNSYLFYWLLSYVTLVMIFERFVMLIAIIRRFNSSCPDWTSLFLTWWFQLFPCWFINYQWIIIGEWTPIDAVLHWNIWHWPIPLLRSPSSFVDVEHFRDVRTRWPIFKYSSWICLPVQKVKRPRS